MYGNPVAQAFIRPPGSPLIVGSFRVTAAFGAIDASHPTPHQGVDFGNGQSFEPILAIEAGTVSLAGLIGTAKVVRVKHANGDESGYAHLATINVVVGQQVARGQRIGTLGSTGASAAHLHLGLKRNGVEIDSWPLLDQNQEDSMPGFKAVGLPIGRFTFSGVHALISPLDPKVHYMQAANAAFDVYANFDLKTPDGKPVDIDGKTPPLNNRDQVFLVDAPNFGVGAYALRTEGAFVPVSPGYSEDDLKDAKRVAARIVAADSAKSAAQF